MEPPFTRQQVRNFVKDTKEEAGYGWRMLGERFQHALVVERAFYVMAGQASMLVSTETMSWLVDAMLAEAGLKPEGER